MIANVHCRWGLGIGMVAAGSRRWIVCDTSTAGGGRIRLGSSDFPVGSDGWRFEESPSLADAWDEEEEEFEDDDEDDEEEEDDDFFPDDEEDDFDDDEEEEEEE